MSRTKNSMKNIYYAIIGQSLALLVSFISRSIFVRALGVEYLGLNGLFTNILSMLSFAELGIGTAIVYSLYKPLSVNNVQKIRALMELYKRAYFIIGITIAIIGTSITPFLPYFIDEMPDINNISTIYLMFVFNSSVSYFYIYKRSLLIADQKRYITTIYRYSMFVLMNLVQIITLLITKNYILFLSLQILFTIVENIAISKKADKIYPYLKKENSKPLDTFTRKNIFKNVRALMGHKLGGIVVNGTDNILTSIFVGIVSVGLYSNYLLIIGALNTVTGMFFQAILASVGNLGVTESKDKLAIVFNRLDFIGFWIYGFISISLLILLNPFISLWLGEDYLFPYYLVIILVINFYLNGMRKSVLTFRDALGLFWYDRHKPFFEAIINLIASMILVRLYGIAGIFIGTTISTLSTCFWVEPYVLFKHGLKTSILSYFKQYIYHTSILIVVGTVTGSVSMLVEGESIYSFLLKILIVLIVPNIMFSIFFIKKTEFIYIFKAMKKNYLILVSQ